MVVYLHVEKETHSIRSKVIEVNVHPLGIINFHSLQTHWRQKRQFSTGRGQVVAEEAAEEAQYYYDRVFAYRKGDALNQK
jgi:hypothetical protein